MKNIKAAALNDLNVVPRRVKISFDKDAMKLNSWISKPSR